MHGSEIHDVASHLSKVRVGGGGEDVLAYVAKYSRSYDY
jgi:hypothetical protein